MSSNTRRTEHRQRRQERQQEQLPREYAQQHVAYTQRVNVFAGIMTFLIIDAVILLIVYAILLWPWPTH